LPNVPHMRFSGEHIPQPNTDGQPAMIAYEVLPNGAELSL